MGGRTQIYQRIFGRTLCTQDYAARAEVAYALYQYQNLSASGSSQSSRILRQI